MTPRALTAITLGAAAFAGAWALRPLDTQSPSAPAVSRESTPAIGAIDKPQPVDLDAFRMPLWTAPPPPPPPPPPPKPVDPPPPMKFKLLAIVTGSDGVRRASLYDPDTDRVQSLASGERCGPAKVEDVGADAVTITDAAGTRTLRLRTDTPESLSSRGGQS